MLDTKFSIKFDFPIRNENLYKSIPMPVSANIEDQKHRYVGEIEGYFLYNDDDFFYKCDNESGDCLKIAEAICEEREYVLKMPGFSFSTE